MDIMRRDKIMPANDVKKYKVEVSLTITYNIDSTLFPEGSSPEECLAMDVAKFRAAPELAMEYNDIKVKGRIIDIIV